MKPKHPALIDEGCSLYRSGKSLKEIKDLICIDEDTLRYHLKKRGMLGANKTHKLTSEHRSCMIELRNQGLSLSQIGDKLGVNKTTVAYCLKKAGLQESPNTPTSVSQEPSHLPPLNAQQISEIIGLRRGGMGLSEIAKKFGRTRASIKMLMFRHKVSVPVETRQSNAYQAKLAKNPNAMQDMRASLTDEVVARRSDSVRERYRNDLELVALKTKQNQEYWASRPRTSRLYGVGDCEACAKTLGLVLVEVEQGVGDRILPGGKCRLVCGCGLQFNALTYDFLYGKIRSCGCVKSHAPGVIAKMLIGWGEKVELNDRAEIAPLELDLWLPDRKLAIEYCGLTVHGEAWNPSKQNSRHLHKLQKCQQKGIRLITIFSDEWISRNDQVVGYLEAILGRKTKVVGARTCRVEKVEVRDIRDFIETNHLQGCAGQEAYRLVGNDGVVLAAATFTKGVGRGGVGPVESTLTRYAVARDFSVPGGLGRILKEWVKHNPSQTKLVTYSDRRWSEGGIYRALGFVRDREIYPSYWYFKSGTDTPRYYKSKFTKKKLGAAENETEWEAAQKIGLDRIWDCGMERWIWHISK